MQIKFISPDPRAGTTVRLDSNRAQHFVEIGSAVALKEDGTEAKPRKPAGPVIDRATLDGAIAELPGTQNDVEYVVHGMRSHFGELFTDDDEKRVRELVPAKPGPKPSEGLKVDEIKAELERRKIAIPDGVTLKADLAALLDAAPPQ